MNIYKALKRTIVFRYALLITVTLIVLFLVWLIYGNQSPSEFNGANAYQHVVKQVEFGPRIPGSIAHQQTVDWIASTLEREDWGVSYVTGEILNQQVKNVVGKRSNAGPWIILGAHYDSRLLADKDIQPENRSQPVPGANDGASGVAVLLELARVLPKDLPINLWLVFFDAEDNGNIPGWDWILGSQYFAENLQGKPDAVIVIDMIGDADLNVYQERSSDPSLTRQIWSSAKDLGFQESFIPVPKYPILDDHVPFLSLGIPAVDIIDFDYPYYHTTHDTPDKVSPDSLEIIGRTLIHWLRNYR